MTHAQVHRLVRRARARLEAVRLLKGAARGGLAGSALGLLSLLLMKAAPAWPVLAAVPWILFGAGAAAGFLTEALRPRIGLAAAALFLDDRLRTQQRIATVATRPPGPLVDRVAAELKDARRLPHLPVPREAALVPAALFVVFAAGLLPAAGAAPPARVVAVAAPGAAAADAGAAAPEVEAETMERLARGEPPGAAEAAELKAAIDGELHRPEQRQAARRLLEQAEAGDGAAARELARRLQAARGASAGGEAAERDPLVRPAPAAAAAGSVTRAVAYPDEQEFLLEYRRALREKE